MSNKTLRTIDKLGDALDTTLIAGEDEKKLESKSLFMRVAKVKWNVVEKKSISIKGFNATLPANISSFKTNSNIRRLVSVSFLHDVLICFSVSNRDIIRNSSSKKKIQAVILELLAPLVSKGCSIGTILGIGKHGMVI